ncbi:MAG: hypothetical protein PWP58_1177 [Bacillota bacterium]|nr:hypothetical protein [Bacillota bacterium]
MRRVLALALIVALLLVFSPAVLLPAQAAPQEGDKGFFWDSPGQSLGIYATTRALDALTALADAQVAVPDLVYRIDAARTYLEDQATNGVWTDPMAGDWAALAVAKAGGDATKHLDALTQNLREKDFAETEKTKSTFVKTTDLARSLLVAQAVYGSDPALSGFLPTLTDKNSRPATDALAARQVAENVYLDGESLPAVRFGLAGVESARDANITAYSVLALFAAGQRPDPGLAADITRWLLAKETTVNGQPQGSWGTDWGPDVDTTAAVLRALSVLNAEVQDADLKAKIAAAKERALGYIRSQQGTDGAIWIDSWPSGRVPSACSTAEAILGLLAWNEGPTGFTNAGKSLVDGLLALQQLTPYVPPAPPAAPEKISVSLQVRGKGEVFFSGTVKLAADAATPLGALRASGLSYGTRGQYVWKIADLAEEGTAGWKYAVNGFVPPVPADSYQLRNGDEVVWFYASSYLDTGGFREDIPVTELKPPKVAEEVKAARDKAAAQAAAELAKVATDPNWSRIAATPIELVRGAVLDLPGDEKTAFSDEELSYWRDALSLNKVDVAQKVSAGREAKVGDELGEVTLSIPAGALEKDETITVKENEGSDKLPLPLTHKLLSHVYSLGPDGISFKEPVTLALKLIVSEDTSASDLVLAYFDGERQVWRPVPAVLDRANGLILAQLMHFSDYAVLKRVELPPSFPDIEEGWEWAKDSISLLALRGVVTGNLVGLYEPERPVTRAEFARFLNRTLNLQPVEGVSFRDIPSGAWYEKDVAACAGAGLFIGAGDRFYPDEPLTREQAAVILARALPQEEAPELTFADKEAISPWARAGVARAQAAGIIQGIGGNTFAPRLPVSRAQAAVLLVRLWAAPIAN